MTFAAMPAWQAWALIALAAALAAWLFRLKVRPPRVFVPSLVLWQRVLDDSRELTLWERIRRAVSLALTILIAASLAVAAARPSGTSRSGSAAGPGRELIVLDSSWSMLARTKSGDSRWDKAVAHAHRLVGAAGGAEVAVATTADGIVEGPTTDRTLLDAALQRLAPAGGTAAALPRLAGARTVHYITDGAVARPTGPDVIVHSVFEPASNVAITAFAVRPALDGGRPGDAYLEVASFAPATQQVRVVIERGAAAIVDRSIALGPSETLRHVVPVESGEGVLRARVSARANALDVDDEAFAVIKRAQPLRVTVVGEDTRWLTDLLDGDAGVRTTVVRPEAFRPGRVPCDVIVFDRYGPHEAAGCPALAFAPPDGVVAASEEREPRWGTVSSHPLVEGIDPFTVVIHRARRYSLPNAKAVAESDKHTPLVYAGTSAGRRFALVTFGPGDSNLAAAPAFPVLVGNALDWLSSLPLPDAGRPGLVPFDADVSSVSGPDGSALPLVRFNGAAVAWLPRPGIYKAEGYGVEGGVAINVADAQVSNLTRTTLPADSVADAAAPPARGIPWWTYCATAAFVLALLEWWTWQRRITV